MRTLLLAFGTVVAAASNPSVPPQAATKVKAEEAYEALQSRLAKAKTLSTTLEVQMLGETERYTFRFLRKNYAKVLSKTAAIFQNGRHYFDFSPIENEYWTQPAPAEGLPAGTAFSLGGVVGLEKLGFPNDPKFEPMSLKTAKWNGVDALVLGLQSETDAALKANLYLDPKTKLPMGWDYRLRDFKSTGKFREFLLDVPMQPSQFAWTPPKGAKKLSIG